MITITIFGYNQEHCTSKSFSYARELTYLSYGIGIIMRLRTWGLGVVGWVHWCLGM